VVPIVQDHELGAQPGSRRRAGQAKIRAEESVVTWARR